MSLKEGSVLFARIDYKIGDSQETEQDAIDSMEYLQKIARERYLAAGVFGNMELGTMDGAWCFLRRRTWRRRRKLRMTTRSSKEAITGATCISGM